MAVPPVIPGVYVEEVHALPNQVTVPTAVPVFIGYTRRADYDGKSCLMKPLKIGSVGDFLAFFGLMTDDTPPVAAADSQQYAPVYHVVASTGAGEVVMGEKLWDLLPDPGTVYYLYNSIRLFYQNGGGTCLVVSVGIMAGPTSCINAAGTPLINPNVKLTDMQAGLAMAAREPDVTIIVIPDAVLLKEADYAILMQDAFEQCNDLMSRVTLIDVYGGQAPDPELYPTAEIPQFRTDMGMNYLCFGIAYFPFLRTTIVQDADVNFLNLGGATELAAVLPNAGIDPLKTVLSQIETPPAANPPSAQQFENALLGASADYARLHDLLLAKINVLPPSGAMAGVYTAVDNTRGVWTAPANVSLGAVTDTTLGITDAALGPLSVDAATGKSINVIRLVPGLGAVVWGARTLDGNSRDWRYVNVRRTVIMIEQSLKLVIRLHAFAPNTAPTWSMVASMITSFLTTVWNQGGLAGASAAESFNVAVGLGTTMTAEDILNGIMNVKVQVAVSQPAEFIEITVLQKMQTS